MKSLGKLFNEEAFEWIDGVCVRAIRTMGIVSIVIVVCWGVYQLLAHTFGGI